MCVDDGWTAGALWFLVSNRMASRIWWTSYTKVFLFTLTCTPDDPKWLSKGPVAQTLQPWFYSTAARDYYSQKNKPFCQKQTTKYTSSKEFWSTALVSLPRPPASALQHSRLWRNPAWAGRPVEPGLRQEAWRGWGCQAQFLLVAYITGVSTVSKHSGKLFHWEIF